MNICFQKTHQRMFGTYPLKGDALAAAVASAVEAGYRGFDTAQMYGNEADLGAALDATGLPRDAFFVVTKVHPDNFSAERFIPSVERSLEALGMEAADVLLLHWPPVGGDVTPSLRRLAEARERGLAREIGVSNYTGAMLRTAREVVSAPIVINQVEFHPLLDQNRLLAAASETGIPLSAYSSVARGAVFKRPEFAEIAAGYGKTAGQVVLRWILQKGVVVNTMSTNPANIRANFDVMDFTLSSIDMDRIDALGSTAGRIVTSEVAPWAPNWD